MGTTKLNLYNKALRHLGERTLASLTEERKPRRLLDDVYDQGGVDYCLEQAQWHFAMRTIQIDYDTAVAPTFGYRRAFKKPSDWILTSAISTDEYFNTPLNQYVDESGYWYCEHDLIYVRYVSNNVEYGKDMGEWPESFEEYAAAWFALQTMLGVTNDTTKYLEMEKIVEKKLLMAKSRSAMTEPTKFPPTGSWNRSRQGGSSGRERGNRNSLLG